MVNRVLVGQHNGQFVARVSVPGVDVMTATQIQHFMMHELYSSDQVLMRGSAILTETMPEYVEIPIPMLGYIPFVEFYMTSAPVSTGVPNSAYARAFPAGAFTTIYIMDGKLTLPNLAVYSPGNIVIYEYAIYLTRGH